MSSFFYETLVCRLSQDKSRYPLLKLNELIDFTDVGALLRERKQSQRQQNRHIKKHRYVIEQCFGTLKRRFDFRRANYFGQEKVKAQSLLKAMCHNLLKAINKVSYA